MIRRDSCTSRSKIRSGSDTDLMIRSRSGSVTRHPQARCEPVLPRPRSWCRRVPPGPKSRPHGYRSRLGDDGSHGGGLAARVGAVRGHSQPTADLVAAGCAGEDRAWPLNDARSEGRGGGQRRPEESEATEGSVASDGNSRLRLFRDCNGGRWGWIGRGGSDGGGLDGGGPDAGGLDGDTTVSRGPPPGHGPRVTRTDQHHGVRLWMTGTARPQMSCFAHDLSTDMGTGVDAAG